jgi:hypothetical protein
MENKGVSLDERQRIMVEKLNEVNTTVTKAETVFTAFQKRYGRAHPKYIEVLTSVAILDLTLLAQLPLGKISSADIYQLRSNSSII